MIRNAEGKSQRIEVFWKEMMVLQCKFHLFENENIHNAIDNEESAHCYVLSMQEESVLSPPTS